MTPARVRYPGRSASAPNRKVIPDENQIETRPVCRGPRPRHPTARRAHRPRQRRRRREGVQRRPGRHHRTGHRGRPRPALRPHRGRQPARRPVPPAAAHQRVPRRRLVLRRLDQGRLPVRRRHPRRHRLDRRAGQAAAGRLRPAGALPGAAQRPLRRERRPARRHRLAVRRRGLLELRHVPGHHDRRARSLRCGLRLRHLERARVRLLLGPGRQHHPVLPDVGHRPPRTAPSRPPRPPSPARRSPTPRSASPRSGPPGSPTSRRPAPCPT